MPDSGSEATNTPSSDLTSLQMTRTRSDVGSITMERTHSDQTHFRSGNGSSHDSRATNTISRKGGEQLGALLKEHFSPTASSQNLPEQDTEEDHQDHPREAEHEDGEEHHQDYDHQAEYEHREEDPQDYDRQAEHEHGEQHHQDHMAEAEYEHKEQGHQHHVREAEYEHGKAEDVTSLLPTESKEADHDPSEEQDSRPDQEQDRSPITRPEVRSVNSHAMSDLVPSHGSINESLDTASSPIMKMQPPEAATPSLRDFPVNDATDARTESGYPNLRQRTDSRPAISPSATSRAISTPAPMSLPEALQDLRPTVKRAQGQRAESELVPIRSPNRSFVFPSRSSAQYGTMSAQERADVLQGRTNQPKSGGSFIRRLIRRASLKGKSQSVGNASSWASTPRRASTNLPPELEIEEGSEAATTPRDGSLRTKSSDTDLKSRPSLNRRNKSNDAPRTRKRSRTSSFFSPFRARDPPKNTNKTSPKNGGIEDESFGHSGPLVHEDAPSMPSTGLPVSSSSSMPAFTQVFLEPRPSNGEAGQGHEEQTQVENQELLQTPEFDDSTTAEQEHMRRRPSSHLTDQSDFGPSIGSAISSRPHYDFQESLGLNDLSASGRQRSEPGGAEAALSGRGQPSGSAIPPKSDGQARPQVGIPRIWQGLEPIESVDDLRTTYSDQEDHDDRVWSDLNMPANKYDTITTNASFRTAASSLDSPRSASARKLRPGSKSSKLSLRTLDTPLARHFDQGSRQDSPLADLITNLERRLSIPSTAGTLGSTLYQDAAASPSSEFLHLRPDEALPALAAGPTPSPPAFDEAASVRGFSKETVHPMGSDSALIETIHDSRRSSMAGGESNDEGDSAEAMDEEIRWHKRDTFGGLASLPTSSWPGTLAASRMSNEPSQSSQISSRSAHVRSNHMDDAVDHDDEETMLPEVKVSDIESHLAAVEAALQDNRQEGSFDPTSLRQRMSDVPFIHGNMSSLSVLSREGTGPFSQPQHQPDTKAGDISMPGAWASDSSSHFATNDEGKRITLAPESHEALADAVRSVRRAISSSQLMETAHAQGAEAGRSVETLGTASVISDVQDSTVDLGIGEVSMPSEATPARAARKRQEGMRDIEEAYSRMLALVHSSAMGATPSPQIRSDESRAGAVPPRRPGKPGLLSPGVRQSLLGSPLAKSSTKTDEPLVQAATQSKRNTIDGVPTNQVGASRSRARGLSMGETRASTSLSGLMGMPLDANAQLLRQSSISSESSTVEAAKNDTIQRETDRKRLSSDLKSNTSRHSQALSRDHAPSNLLEHDGFRKRFSSDNTTIGRTSSGGGHTSPSATAKTLGTPRSFATSVSQHSLAHILRRHDLEKESLLDSLERARAELMDIQARNESLTADLHAEVTRVLELERELERRDTREMDLIGQIQGLESELLEIKYLDSLLRNVDQSMDSEDAEGSIMDVEIPTSSARDRTDQWAQSQGHDHSRQKTGLLSPATSNRSTLPGTRPSHRVTKSDAFVHSTTNRSNIPASKSEQTWARPVSLVNGPAGLTRDDSASRNSSMASPVPTASNGSLLRTARPSHAKSSQGPEKSPTMLGLSLEREEENWNLADEQQPPEMSDVVEERFKDSAQNTLPSGPSDSSPEAPSSEAVAANATPRREPQSATKPHVGSIARSGSGLPRPAPSISASRLAYPPSRSSGGGGGATDTPSSVRSMSSRLPTLGLKSSASPRYNKTSASTAFRSISGATDKSTASTLSSVFSNSSGGGPPSLSTLPSANNTMEEEIQAELARLGNPRPYLRYYSPPRSKMI